MILTSGHSKNGWGRQAQPLTHISFTFTDNITQYGHKIGLNCQFFLIGRTKSKGEKMYHCLILPANLFLSICPINNCTFNKCKKIDFKRIYACYKKMFVIGPPVAAAVWRVGPTHNKFHFLLQLNLPIRPLLSLTNDPHQLSNWYSSVDFEIWLLRYLGIKKYKNVQTHAIGGHPWCIFCHL